MLVALVITYMFHWFFIFPFFYFCIFSWYLSREFHDYFFCIIIILNIINEILEIFFDIFPSWNSWCSCFFSSFIYSLLFLRFKQVICNHIKRKKFVNGSIIFFYYFSFSAHADITRFKACLPILNLILSISSYHVDYDRAINNFINYLFEYHVEYFM
jgi:hypothetical protein